MATAESHSVTRLLEAARSGEKTAFDEAFALIYGELKRVAARAARRERNAPTLQTTALVHEAYMRLGGGRPLAARDRAEFLGIAARSMREILVDRARARNAAKRGNGLRPVELVEGDVSTQPPGVDVLALDQALNRLAARDARKARIVELRYFAGLTVDETAALLDVAPVTVKREWSVARAWLFRELAAQP